MGKSQVQSTVIQDAKLNVKRMNRIDIVELKPFFSRRKKKFQQDCDVPVAIEVPQKSVEKKTAINCESSSNFALSRYEALCKFVSAENFEGLNFLDQFTAGN